MSTAETTTARAAGATFSDTERTVRDAVADVLPHLAPADIPLDVHLKDLGADSVDRVEILLGVTGVLGVAVPLSEFSSVPDLRGLITLLDGWRTS